MRVVVAQLLHQWGLCYYRQRRRQSWKWSLIYSIWY